MATYVFVKDLQFGCVERSITCSTTFFGHAILEHLLVNVFMLFLAGDGSQRKTNVSTSSIDRQYVVLVHFIDLFGIH